MRFSPRLYQQQALTRMIANPHQLIALRMGSGKTAIALLAAQEFLNVEGDTKRVLIVAPKRVAELVWHTEAKKWDQTKDLKIVRVLGSRDQRIAALRTKADLHVINRENFSWLVDLELEQRGHWSFDCVVIDENWGFKNQKSKNWLQLKRIRSQIKRLYLLTGTPTPNSLLELWPLVSILDKGQRLGKGFSAFRERWFNPDKRNGHIVYSWAPKPGAAEAIHELVRDVMFSIESDLELPNRLDNIISVDMPQKRYREMAEEMVSGPLSAASAGILAGKLAQMANGACYDGFGSVHDIHDEKLEALAEIIEQGEPVLCFTTFRQDQARILKRFPFAKVFEGASTLDQWKRGNINLLLMHPASGGHGVDGLQFGGRVAVWFGLPFSLDLYQQANARLCRPGQSKGVVIHHLIATNTIDEHIMRALQAKSDVQQALIDAVELFCKEAVA